METRQVGKLTLRTFDILQNNTLSDTDNSIGTIACNAQLLTWKDVNMRLVLGDLYDKYEKFNMKLVAFSHRPPTTNLTANNNVLFYLSGLNISYGAYYHPSRGMRHETVIGASILRSATTGTNNAFYDITTSISKPKEYETITIEIKNNSTQVVGGRDEKINQMIGHTTFILEFTPVDE